MFAAEQKVNLINQTASVIYSPEELKVLFATEEFKKINSEVRDQLNAFSETEQRKFSDSEIAFRWGSSWIGLAEYLKSAERLEAIMKQMNGDFVMSERYVPDFLRQRQKPVLGPEWTQLTWQQITDLVGHVHSRRVMEINRVAPGFAIWLLEGSSAISWVLTDEPLSQKFCQNAQVFQIQKKTVACQSFELVQIQRAWFQQASPKDIADVFVHELIRYRTNLLAKGFRLEQSTQDAITAQISESILNSTVSPEDLYQQLEKTNLLIDSARISELRVYELVLTMKKKMKALSEMIRFNMICDQRPLISKEAFGLLRQEALRQINECQRYLTPDYDKTMCETKTLAFQIWDHRKRCLRSR